MSVGQRGRAAAPASYGLVIGLRFVLALRFVGLGLVLLYICDLDRFLQFWKQAMRKAGVGRGVPTLDSEEAPHWEPVALGEDTHPVPS